MDFLDKRVGVICNELKKLKVKQGSTRKETLFTRRMH